MDELMLERLLERASSNTTYPPTPAVRRLVLAAIAEPVPTAASRRPALALAAIAMIAFVLAIALAVPTSRSAIAEFFGVEGSKIERLPTPAPGVTPTPLSTPAEIGTYAQPSTLADAAAAVGFTPALAPGLGEPAVYLARYSKESVVILRYPGLDLWEMKARDLNFGKGLAEDVIVRDLAVNGRAAYWIEGGPHAVYLFDRTGEVPGSERTVARNTLIWRTDFAFYRIETTLSQADALRIAETLP